MRKSVLCVLSVLKLGCIEVTFGEGGLVLSSGFPMSSGFDVVCPARRLPSREETRIGRTGGDG